MTPDEAKKAMMSMYGPERSVDVGDDGLVRPSASPETAHDARMMGGHDDGSVGIRDMPEFQHGPKGPFVDRINGDVAVLLMPDGSTSEIPADQLPKGTHEGAYLGSNGVDDLLGETGRIDALRKKLNAGDDGGDIKL